MGGGRENGVGGLQCLSKKSWVLLNERRGIDLEANRKQKNGFQTPKGCAKKI